MRKHYLDNVRWITVIIVLIYHVFYMYNAEGVFGGLGKITNLEVQYYDAFMYLVYPWFMPVLFLVSGISAKLSLDRKSDKEFLRARTLKLLVPSTIGLFVFWFIQGYVSMSLGGAFEGLMSAGVPKPVIYMIMAATGSGVMWYMHLLWIYCVVLLLIRKVEKGKLLAAGAKTPLWLVVLFLLPIWGASQILNTPMVSVYRFAFYFVFFVLGYFVFSHDEVIGKLKKIAVPLIVVAVALCVVFVILYFGQNYADKPINRGLFYALDAYVGSLAMIAGMARYGDFSTPFTQWMSKRSFGLYVFHYLGISSVALFVAKPGLLPPALCYILSLIAGFAFGYGLYALISKIPFFRWAVLGIAKKKEK